MLFTKNIIYLSYNTTLNHNSMSVIGQNKVFELSSTVLPKKGKSIALMEKKATLFLFKLFISGDIKCHATKAPYRKRGTLYPL